MYLLLLAQQAAPAGGDLLDGWAKFILLLVLQGGSLAILAYLTLRTLPETVEKLAAMRSTDLDRFDARTKELKDEIHVLHMESMKTVNRCINLIMDIRTETTESINMLLPPGSRPKPPEGR